MANESVHNPVPALLLAAVAVLSFCPQPGSMADDSTLDRPVRSFYSSNQNVHDAMLRFGRENNVPIGLVFRDRLCSTELGQLSIKNTSAGSVIQELTRRVPAYSWKFEDETVIVLPDDIPAATSSFLELRVPNYSIPEDTLQAQVAFAWMNIKASLRPNEGTAFDILSSPQSVKRPSLALNNLNVEQVLDHLIARKPGGVWIVFPFDDLDKAADKRPFWVTAYSDDPQGPTTSPCIRPKAQRSEQK